MKFNLHNKIEIYNCKNKYCFYNTMLKSVINQFKTLDSFNDYLALGVGTRTHLDTNFNLINYKKSYKLESDFIQNDVSIATGNYYIKKTVLIDDYSLDGLYLTEAGITNSNSDNPIVYNYFSLVSSEFPNGILKNKGEPLAIS